MAEEQPHVRPSPPKPPLGLMGWIAGYKLLKSAGMLALAIESVRYRHSDLLPLLKKWIAWFDLDPHGKFVEALGNHLLHLSSSRFQWVRGALFVYFVLFAVEGIGLMLEAIWAEWLTVLATALLLPAAIYEMMHHPTLTRFILVQFNLGVIAYLLWRLRRDAGWRMQRTLKS
jgi:uncharacterized membrane protein (DUF2068 family)